MHWEAISCHRITVSPKTPAPKTIRGKKGDEIAYLIEDMYDYICYILQFISCTIGTILYILHYMYKIHTYKVL